MANAVIHGTPVASNTLEYLIQSNDRNLATFIASDLLQRAPFLRAAYAQNASNGTQHKFEVETDEPGVAFRNVNEGRENAAGKSKIVTIDLKIVDASFERDQAVADGYKDGATMYMEREGVTSFKAYMAYENLRLNDKELLELFKATADIGVVGVHCELGDEVNSRVARLLAEGKTGPEWHPRSRPNEVESLAVRRCLALAREAGGNAWVVHLSTREGLAEIEAARGTGQRVLVETCPQYLTLTDEVYEKPDFEGAKFVCSPPIRSEADKAALWGGIKAGEVDIISTDHCSFNFKRQKELGRGNFSKIPNGLPGIEHRPMLLWTEGVNTGKLSAEEFCRLLSTEPAKAFGMYPRKGELKPGADADIVVWDPEATMRLTATDMNMLADYSPWEGAQLRGLPKAVFLHGELAAEKGRVKKPCGGRYVRREKSLGF